MPTPPQMLPATAGRSQMGVGGPCGFADEDGGEDLAAGGDAVGEVAEADDEGQHPDDHDGAGDGVGAGDEPRYCRYDPAAHDAAPEDGGGGGCGWLRGRGLRRLERSPA